MSWDNGKPFVAGGGGIGDLLLAIATSYKFGKVRVLYSPNPGVKDQISKILKAFNLDYFLLPNMCALQDAMTNPNCVSVGHLPGKLNYIDWKHKDKYESKIVTTMPVQDLFGQVQTDKPIVVIQPASNVQEVEVSENSGRLMKSRAIDINSYSALVLKYLPTHYVYVIGGEQQFGTYSMNHSNFYWINFDTIVHQKNKGPGSVRKLFAIINSSQAMFGIDSWAKTYACMANVIPTVFKSRFNGRYEDIGFDTSDNIFLNTNIWNMNIMTIEECVECKMVVDTPLFSLATNN